MSTADILNELPRLTPHERRQIAERLVELEDAAQESPTGVMPAEAAADLRTRLASFAEEWDSPEMSNYDNYDAAKAKLRSR